MRRYRFDPYLLDLAKRELSRDGAVQVLPARVFECLCCLIENRERAVSRDELSQAVFSRSDVSDSQLAQIVLRSRRAVGDDGNEQRAIRTVPRFGFGWSTEVVVENDETEEIARSVIGDVPAHPRPEVPMQSELAIRTVEVPSSLARRRILAATILVVATVALAAPVAWVMRQAPEASGAQKGQAGGSGILVLPTRIDGADDIAWARLGLMDLVVDRMRRAGLPALSSDATLAVLHQNRDIEREPQRLRTLLRARWLVSGEVTSAGSQWKVRLSATDAIGVVQLGQATGRDLVDTTRIASDRLLATLGAEPRLGEEADSRLSERLQRARSAMLANELDTARRILMEAPELQSAQPQLRYHLAQIDFRAGEYPRGLGTLDSLLAASKVGSDDLFTARLHISRGSMLIRLDRYSEAEQSYDAAVRSLTGSRFATELGQALTGRAVARSSQRNFDLALSDLGQARVQLTRVGDLLGVARVDANLGNLEMDRDRPALAVDYYRKAAGDMQALGAINELAAIRCMLTAAHLEMLDMAKALEESGRAWQLRERIRDPAQRANVILTRADALLAAGQVSEATRLLQMPETGRVAPGEFRRPEFLRIEIARQRGDARAILGLADAALKDWPSTHNTPLRGWILLRRIQAAQKLDIAPPRANLFAGNDVPAQLVEATADRLRGDSTAAGHRYRSALALAESRGIPAEIAEVVEAYAGWLLDTDRAGNASALIGRVAPWAEQDFELSLLQVRLLQKTGQRDQWNHALTHARGLAGERAVPGELMTFATGSQSHANQ